MSLTLVLSCLLVASGFAIAQPKVKEDDSKFVLSNEHVTIWFQGKKPMLKVFPTREDASNDTGAFTYTFRNVVEYRDVDGDGAPSDAEVVARLGLEAAKFNVTRNDADDAVRLALTLNDSVKLTAGINGLAQNVSLPDRLANVTLDFTLRSGSAIKYDFVVDKWPWVDATSNRLALEMRVTGNVKRLNESEAGGAAIVEANGTSVGDLTWLTTAEGNTTAGTRVDVPVKASIANESAGITRVAFTYDAPDLATIVHDPTIGVTDPQGAPLESDDGGSDAKTTRGVPGPALVIALAAVGVALALRGRR